MSRFLAALGIALGITALAPPPRAAATGGVPLCAAVRDQTAPAMVPDALGGAFVGWLDARLGYNIDIYVCRSDSTGAPAAGWPVNGAALTNVTCTKTELAMAPDGFGGALAAWSDNRCNGGSYDLYVSRIGPSGARPGGWPLNGVALCALSGDQRRAALAGDGTGGAIVAWVDKRTAPAQLFAARVRANGALDPAWPVAGLLVASAVADSARPAVISDGAGGVYVTWEDTRGGALDLYAQRLDSTGVAPPGWPAQGLGLCTATGNQWGARLVADGASGAIAAWQDRRTGTSQIRALRFTPTGSVAAGWAADGNVLASGTAEQSGLALIADGAGGAVAAWQERRVPASGTDLYATRVDAGALLVPGWGATGTALCTAVGDQADVSLALSPGGWLQFAWVDARNVALSGTDVYGQRLSLLGAPGPSWPADGLALCDAARDQRSPALTSNLATGMLAAWSDGRNLPTTGYDIAVGLVTPAGPADMQAHGLQAIHHDGQTFLTWARPPGAGWTHRVYRSTAPIAVSADLAGATLVATLRDSTAYDRRYSVAANVPAGFRVDSLAAPLDPAQGLLVLTPPGERSTYFAVTSESGTFGEDRSVLPGGNALATPIAEFLGSPRPVFQRTLSVSGSSVGVYTLFPSMTDTPLFPAMANRPDMKFDCALAPGLPGPGSSLMLPLHWRNGSFMNSLTGTHRAGEWVLALDDGLPNGQNTWWYGYHPDYDATAAGGWPIPTTGTVVDYTMRRLRYTIDWALHSFPIDSTRVYTFGYSLGGSGSALLAFHLPDRIAASMSVIGKLNFAYLNDPDTAAWFNTGGEYRRATDPMWGTVGTNLPSSDGRLTYESLNQSWVAAQASVKTIPPLLAFNGKLDDAVGWAEKVEFYAAMNLHRRGGYFFWDMRSHSSVGLPTWTYMQSLPYLYRFRSDLSFPALSNCSVDWEPGNGTAASGDSVGAINAYVEWDTLLVDQPTRWEARLWTRELVQLGLVVLPPPDSCTVDVTPARIQRFILPPGSPVSFKVVRQSDSCVVQQGSVIVDSLGRVTIPAVKVYAQGSRVLLGSESWLEVPGGPAVPRLALLLQRNPVRGPTALSVQWPRGESGRLELLDVGGRRVQTLFDGPLAAGLSRFVLDTTHLPSGVYFARARCGNDSVTRRVVVLH